MELLSGGFSLRRCSSEAASTWGVSVPYVRQELIKEIKPALKTTYGDLYSGTADLYVFFYYRALQLLKQQGMLVFISSNKWFRANYGAKLRAHIAATCRVHSITDFGELPVFEAAATAYPMIFIAANGEPGYSNYFYTDWISRTAVPRHASAYSGARPVSACQRNAAGSDWALTDASSLAYLDEIEKRWDAAWPVHPRTPL